MSKITVVVEDKTVIVDGDARLCDFDTTAIQKVLAGQASLRAIHWEGGGGYLERNQGLSQDTQDPKVIEPFISAHTKAKKRDVKAENLERSRFEKFLQEVKEKEEKEKAQAEKDRQRNAEQALKIRAWEAEQAAQMKRREATDRVITLLQESDLVILRCTENNIEIPQNWKNYREELRKIARAAPPDIKKVKWPRKPQKPKGLT